MTRKRLNLFLFLGFYDRKHLYENVTVELYINYDNYVRNFHDENVGFINILFAKGTNKVNDSFSVWLTGIRGTFIYWIRILPYGTICWGVNDIFIASTK